MSKRTSINSKPYFKDNGRLRAIMLVLMCLAFNSCMIKDSKQDDWLEYIRLANEKLKVGDYLSAEDLYLKAKQQCETSFGANDARTGTCLGYLAELYRGEQEYVKAAVTYKIMIEIERRCAPHSAELDRAIKEYEHVMQKVKEYGLEDTMIRRGSAESIIGNPKQDED